MCRALLMGSAIGLLLGTAGLSQTVLGQRTANERICVERNPQTLVTHVKIRATRGQVAWSDVLCGVARARGYDDAALEGLLPAGTFSIASPIWLLTAAGINAALEPGILFTTEPGATPSEEPWLVVRMDRAVLLASQRKFKTLFRRTLFRDPGGSAGGYGLLLEDGWEDLPATRDLVVLVPGLGSSPKAMQGLLEAVRAEGFLCGAFGYPNSRPIADSAEALSRELAAIAERHPGRGMSLVAHSMGGLVSRAVIEDPDLDPGNVRQLIMIATPNHGSNLAYFGFAMEIAEPLLTAERRSRVGEFFSTLEDGLSEASVDLIPGSPFLRTLNDRPRNSKVHYTLFLGDKGVLSEQELTAVRRHLAEQGDRNRWVHFFGSRADTWLEDLDEVVQGKGDGAVALKRGELEGIEDTVVLSFGHVEVLRAPGAGDVKKVHDGVIARLKQYASPR